MPGDWLDGKNAFACFVHVLSGYALTRRQRNMLLILPGRLFLPALYLSSYVIRVFTYWFGPEGIIYRGRTLIFVKVHLCFVWGFLGRENTTVGLGWFGVWLSEISACMVTYDAGMPGCRVEPQRLAYVVSAFYLVGL
jgi:hypothetical protein